VPSRLADEAAWGRGAGRLFLFAFATLLNSLSSRAHRDMAGSS
jgi:hypothetical protein